MAKETYLHLKKNWCKRCGICIEFCPQSVFKVGKDGYPIINDVQGCTECRLCVALCPDFAIMTDPKVTKSLAGR